MKYVLTLLLVFAATLLARPAQAADTEGCLNCHQYQGLARIDDSGKHVASFFIDPAFYTQGQGPHARLSCTDCHRREEVEVFPHQPVTKVDCMQACHLQSKGKMELRFSHAPVARMLDRSVHKSDTMVTANAMLGGPLIAQQSKCLLCHDDPMFRDVQSWMGSEVSTQRCQTCHDASMPTDAMFDFQHVHARTTPELSSASVVRTCGLCHSNAAIKAQFHLPDSTATFLASFHGKAVMLGSTNTADCLNCHAGLGQNVHAMLKHDAAGAPTSATRLPETCRTSGCHGTAGAQISTASVHLDIASTHGIEFFITCIFITIIAFTFGPTLLLTTLKLFHHVLARHDPEHRHHSHLAEVLLAKSHTREKLVRFHIHQRVQHWVLAVSFTTLCITGFPMKFADRPWAAWVIEHIGSLSAARAIHHFAGTMLIGGLMYHAIYVLSIVWRNRKIGNQGLIGSVKSLPLAPTPKDGLEMLKLTLYYAFLRKTKPASGKFGPEEKFEYAGVFWGTFTLGVTGLLMWANAWTTRHLPGRILTIAVLLHTFEAFLALLHIGIGHMTHVIFSPSVFPVSRAMITGETPKEKLIKSHGGLLQELATEAGMTAPQEVPHV